jgi:hypothetical protein
MLATIREAEANDATYIRTGNDCSGPVKSTEQAGRLRQCRISRSRTQRYYSGFKIFEGGNINSESALQKALMVVLGALELCEHATAKRDCVRTVHPTGRELLSDIIL